MHGLVRLQQRSTAARAGGAQGATPAVVIVEGQRRPGGGHRELHQLGLQWGGVGGLTAVATVSGSEAPPSQRAHWRWDWRGGGRAAPSRPEHEEIYTQQSRPISAAVAFRRETSGPRRFVLLPL